VRARSGGNALERRALVRRRVGRRERGEQSLRGRHASAQLVKSASSVVVSGSVSTAGTGTSAGAGGSDEAGAPVDSRRTGPDFSVALRPSTRPADLTGNVARTAGPPTLAKRMRGGRVWSALWAAAKRSMPGTFLALANQRGLNGLDVSGTRAVSREPVRRDVVGEHDSWSPSRGGRGRPRAVAMMPSVRAAGSMTCGCRKSSNAALG
jgi:hypothetical protein